MSQKLAGAIDIGSNSILLTIASLGTPNAIPLKIVVDEAHVTGLAKGLLKDGNISDERRDRSLNVLKDYATQLRSHQVTNFKVTGTEAFRKAKNGTAIKEKFEAALGAPIEIISGDREAELSFWSVQKELQNSQLKIVFDIGGASTELCLGNDKGIQERVSLKVGSVLMTEKFGLQKKNSPAHALNYMKELLAEVSWLKNLPSTQGVGVAGTMTTLIACEQKLSTYDRARVHRQTIPKDRVQAWLKNFTDRDAGDRIFPGLTPDRADVISGGVAIQIGLMDFFGWNEILCMDSGVRFGVLYELLQPSNI